MIKYQSVKKKTNLISARTEGATMIQLFGHLAPQQNGDKSRITDIRLDIKYIVV